mmetsp:Transcript_89703/g.231549  ORF Transcript_89703/g.231549 Transcript_89703/m.231549 type:complete len:265 (-) Transcript_89703:32-826(-)
MADSADRMTKAAPLYSNQHLLDFDWGTVTAAWLQKFPDPALPQVSSVETVAWNLCEENQTLHVRRLFLCHFKIPRIVERILGKKAQVVCVEEAHWDLKRRRLTVHGRNESMQNLVRINEVCCFTEVEKGQTLYTQSATVMYRNGILSGLLMPMVNEIFAGICQKHVHKGITAMQARSAREAAFMNGECHEETRLAPMGSAAPAGSGPWLAYGASTVTAVLIAAGCCRGFMFPVVGAAAAGAGAVGAAIAEQWFAPRKSGPPVAE